MSIARRLAARGAASLIGPWSLSRAAARVGARALVLNYHVMRAAEMRAHLALLEPLFELVPIDELPQRVATQRPPRGRLPASLTFDDGKRSHLTEVAPVLEEHGVHATFFVTSQPSASGAVHWFDLAERVARAFASRFGNGLETADAELRELLGDAPAGLLLRPRGTPAGPRLDCGALKQLDSMQRDAILARLVDRLAVDPRPVNDDERPLSPDEVAALARRGFAVGSHSVTHPILTRESPERAWHEIADSHAAISEWIGRPVQHFCYPNGNANDATERMTREAGYATAWTTIPKWLGAADDAHRLPRVQVFPDFDAGEIRLKAALALIGVLPNPDGTGRAYRYRPAR